MGYHKAGFEVVGVDIKPQPHYPFQFIQADAFVMLDHLSTAGPYDVIHASPKCQHYSKSVSKKQRLNHPDQVGPARYMLKNTRLPYVIENVPGAPLINPVQLCGTAVGLKGIQRHRLFETNFPVMAPPCNHAINEPQFPPAWNRKNPLRVRPISGGWTSADDFEGDKRAMGIDWDVTPKELSEAIPPAYTQLIGEQLLAVLEGAA